MSRRYLYLFILSFFITSTFVQAQYSGGDGTSDNPYQIGSISDFYSLGSNTEDYAKCFIVTQELNFSTETLTQAIIAPHNPIEPEYNGTPFSGVFDGGGHDISYLNILAETGENSHFLGLFGKIQNATVKNISLPNIALNGNNYVGSICGWSENSTIHNCSMTTNHLDYEAVGGGICGKNIGGTISQCVASGTATINEEDFARGGICGWNKEGTIRECESNMVQNIRLKTVSNSEICSMGGICGLNEGTIINSLSRGQFDCGVAYCGGISGINIGTIEHSLALHTYNSLATGILGGVCGLNTLPPSEGISGGTGNTLGSFWDSMKNPVSSDAGGEGLSTQDLQTRATYENAGWDLLFDDSDGTEDSWRFSEGLYPFLTWKNNGVFSIHNYQLPASMKIIYTIGRTFPIALTYNSEEYTFLHWQVEPESLQGYVSDLYSESITLTIPYEEITVTAIFKIAPTQLTVDSTAMTINNLAHAGQIGELPFTISEQNEIMQVTFEGDFDTTGISPITGTGNRGVQFHAKNNAIIKEDTVFTFSANGPTPGAGGGVGGDSQEGGDGGDGGLKYQTIYGGTGGNGGLAFLAWSILNDGADGNTGSQFHGAAGEPGINGASGIQGQNGIHSDQGGAGGIASEPGALGTAGGAGTTGGGGAGGKKQFDCWQSGNHGSNGGDGENGNPGGHGGDAIHAKPGAGGMNTIRGAQISGGSGGGSGGSGSGGGGGGTGGSGGSGKGGGGGGAAYVYTFFPIPIATDNLSGGDGGDGGRGGSPGAGGDGGNGSASGAGGSGGGAFELSALGIITIDNTVRFEAAGSDGESSTNATEGTSGGTGYSGMDGYTGESGIAGGAYFSGTGGDGGNGGNGGAGGDGGNGGNGGDGGGGSGGTIKLFASAIEAGAISINTDGGMGTNPGGDGRFIYGCNTDQTFSGNISGAIQESYSGPKKENPFILDAGSQPVETPYIPNLKDGAEVYGFMENIDTQNNYFDLIRSNAPENAVAAIFRPENGPPEYPENYPEYDLLLFISITDGNLQSPELGIDLEASNSSFLQPLIEGGYTRNEAQNISTLSGYSIYALLIPEAATLVNARITSESETFNASQTIALGEYYFLGTSTQINTGAEHWQHFE